MDLLRERRPFGRKHSRRKPRLGEPEHVEDRNHSGTGEEASFLRSLVDSRATVTVVLKNGERLRGRIRYYDRHCFSVGPDGGPKIFLRKSSLSYIAED